VVDTSSERVYGESPLKELSEGIKEVPQGENKVVSKTATEETKPTPFPEKENKEPSVQSDEYKEWMRKEKEDHYKRIEQLERVAVNARSKELSEMDKARKKAFLDDAEKLFNEGKYIDAMTRYAEALRLDPYDRQVLEKWNECYRLSGMRVEMPKIGTVGGGDNRESVPPELAEKVLLLEQKFAAAEQLMRDGKPEEAKKKFNEVIEMILWEKAKIDRKGCFTKAKEYLKRLEDTESKNKEEEKKDDKRDSDKDEKKSEENNDGK